jgi:uncharacterized membrane protein YcaP (DUF421 family)
MPGIFHIDWRSVFVPATSLVEVVVRGTFVYLFLLACMRIFRRGAGTIGVTDLLLVVLIADAAQNAMGSEYRSITEGAVLVATILFWDFALDALGYRFPIVRRLIRPAPLQLVQDGRILKRNLRKGLVTEEELKSLLREQGVEDPAEVKLACLEGDGHFSVVKQESGGGNGEGSGKGKGARASVS